MDALWIKSTVGLLNHKLVEGRIAVFKTRSEGLLDGFLTSARPGSYTGHWEVYKYGM